MLGTWKFFSNEKKYKRPCTEGIPEYDQHLIKWIIKKVGCKPPYWATISSLPLCSIFEEMNSTFELIKSATSGNLQSKHYTGVPPCRRLEKIQYEHRDIDLVETKSQSFTIQLNYKEVSYKEIKSVRSMDIQGLIGSNSFYRDFRVEVSHFVIAIIAFRLFR